MFEIYAIVTLIALSVLMVFDKPRAKTTADRPARPVVSRMSAEVAQREAEAAARFEQDFVRRFHEEMAGS